MTPKFIINIESKLYIQSNAKSLLKLSFMTKQKTENYFMIMSFVNIHVTKEVNKSIDRLRNLFCSLHLDLIL